MWENKNHIFNKLIALRRNFLTFITPEFVWPKSVIIDNVDIKIRGEPSTFGIKLSLKKGEYEGPERNLLKPYNLIGKTIIEMGGSIGILTAVLGNKVGKKGKVISIEASKKISTYSRSWLEKNDNTKVITSFGFPLGKVKGTVDIINFDESGNILQGHVLYPINPDGQIHNDLVYDIQKIVCIFKIQPTILVCDIEGSEKIILDQKPDFPSTIKLILIELHPALYGESNKLEIINRIIAEEFIMKANEGNIFLFERSN